MSACKNPNVSVVTLNEDDWVDTFKPMPDPEDNGAGYDCGNGSCLIEGSCQAFKDADENRIWTLVSDDDGNPCIVAGVHHVNRLGYIITEMPRSTDVSSYEIIMDED